MIEPAYSFCPHCGGKLVIEERRGLDFQVCSVCKRTLYINQPLTVSAAIVRKGKLLVVKRAVAPFKGMLDLPGGYVEPEETAREAMLRELHEELHVEGKIIKPYEVLGPDAYPYEDVIRHNADMLYQVDIGVQEPKPDDDVAGISWVPLKELTPDNFAFHSHQHFVSGLASGQYTLD